MTLSWLSASWTALRGCRAGMELGRSSGNVPRCRGKSGNGQMFSKETVSVHWSVSVRTGAVVPDCGREKGSAGTFLKNREQDLCIESGQVIDEDPETFRFPGAGFQKKAKKRGFLLPRVCAGRLGVRKNPEPERLEENFKRGRSIMKCMKCGKEAFAGTTEESVETGFDVY